MLFFGGIPNNTKSQLLKQPQRVPELLLPIYDKIFYKIAMLCVIDKPCWQDDGLFGFITPSPLQIPFYGPPVL